MDDFSSNGSQEAKTMTNFNQILQDNEQNLSKILLKSKAGSSSLKNLDQVEKVKLGLKACKGDAGFFNPQQAFECLNDIQKE